ncbi:MAG TPA: hypothetical protein O0X97_04765 [Methanocorpusculum sp.]|nr:hypothetical protein [Methanocorpusculum sp.]
MVSRQYDDFGREIPRSSGESPAKRLSRSEIKLLGHIAEGNHMRANLRRFVTTGGGQITISEAYKMLDDTLLSLAQEGFIVKITGLDGFTLTPAGADILDKVRAAEEAAVREKQFVYPVGYFGDTGKSREQSLKKAPVSSETIRPLQIAEERNIPEGTGRDLQRAKKRAALTSAGWFEDDDF